MGIATTINRATSFVVSLTFLSLCERLNWLGATLDDDETGHALLEAGIKRETLMQWTKDPQVDLEGSMTSLFDAFEDLDSKECLAKAVEIERVDAFGE